MKSLSSAAVAFGREALNAAGRERIPTDFCNSQKESLMIANPTPNKLDRSRFNLQGNPINALVLSAWRTAFAAMLFETDKSRMMLVVSQAHAALAERLNSQVEISDIEHKSIRAARNALCKISLAHTGLKMNSEGCSK